MTTSNRMWRKPLKDFDEHVLEETVASTKTAILKLVGVSVLVHWRRRSHEIETLLGE